MVFGGIRDGETVGGGGGGRFREPAVHTGLTRTVCQSANEDTPALCLDCCCCGFFIAVRWTCALQVFDPVGEHVDVHHCAVELERVAQPLLDPWCWMPGRCRGVVVVHERLDRLDRAAQARNRGRTEQRRTRHRERPPANIEPHDRVFFSPDHFPANLNWTFALGAPR